MRCALRQREAVGQPVVDAAGARSRRPAVAGLRLLLQVDPVVPVGPVAHDVEGGLAVGDELRRVLPRQRGSVGVRVGEQGLVAVQRERHAGAVPAVAGLPERCPAGRPDRRDHHGLEQMLLRPLLAERQRDHACRLRLVQRGDELSPPRRHLGDPGLLQNRRVVPEHVRAMDVHRDRVDVALVGDLADQPLRHDLGEAVLLVDEVDRLHLTGLDVVQQLSAGVTLERVRRLLRREPLREHCLRVRPCAARNGLVLERRPGMLLVPDRDQLLEAVRLTAARPPGEHLELRRRRCLLDSLLPAVGRGGDDEQYGRHGEQRAAKDRSAREPGKATFFITCHLRPFFGSQTPIIAR